MTKCHVMSLPHDVVGEDEKRKRGKENESESERSIYTLYDDVLPSNGRAV